MWTPYLLISVTLLAFFSSRHVTMAVPSETTVAVGAATEGNCSVLHHVFVQNGTRGIDVTIVTSLAAGRNSNTSTRVPGVHLPSECGSANAQCNTTVVHPEDGNLTLLIPVVGGVLILTYWYDPGSGWSPAPSEPLGFVLEVPGNCNPVAVGYIQDSTLSVLCLNLSPLGIQFRTLLLTLDAADPRRSSLAEIGVYDGRPQPWLSNILLIQVLANCPLLSMVTAVVAFVHGEDVIMAAISQTAPQPFSKVTLLLGDMCPGPLLEYYGGDTFLLRCSAGEALTFDPCHQPGLRVANHSVSIPYPCSTWDVVAWMYTTNNSLVVRFENGTRTQPIILGDVSEARCVNSKDPRFVYRHVNGSVYVVRIQDGHVTMLGTSVCSGPSSSPALCSGLDFTEHKGSFYVGFFDGLTYKMANLSCPGEAPASMGVPFRPDLSTYFVGPDEQSCLCSPQAPTLPPPASSLSSGVMAAITITTVFVACLLFVVILIILVALRKQYKKSYQPVAAQEEGNDEQAVQATGDRQVSFDGRMVPSRTSDSDNPPVNTSAILESRELPQYPALAMSNTPLLPNMGQHV